MEQQPDRTPRSLEDRMKTTLSMIAAPAAAMTLVKGALLAGALSALAPGARWPTTCQTEAPRLM
jgi:hypothetical protein